MSDEKQIDDGGEAFPEMATQYAPGTDDENTIWPTDYGRGGMNKREVYASRLMASMFNGFTPESSTAPAIYHICAREAVSAADALIAALKAPTPKDNHEL